MSALGGLEPIGVSPIVVSIRVLIPLINNMITADRCRTVVVNYHNDSTEIATEVFRAIDPFRAPVLSVNVDNPNYVPPDDYELGFYLFNICVLKNINTSPRQKRMLSLIDTQATNSQFIIFQEKASEDQIEDFFKLLWNERKMSKVAVFFLGETVEVYTHFPYHKRFGVKMDEFHVSNPMLSPNAYVKYFQGKVNNLQDAQINVYMSENFPKTFMVPARYRVTQEYFYFVGRDGLAAQNIHLALNANWQYKTLPAHLVTRISPFEFGNETQLTDGMKVESVPEWENLEYVNLHEGEPIS